jgi:hypothetical protein
MPRNSDCRFNAAESASFQMQKLKSFGRIDGMPLEKLTRERIVQALSLLGQKAAEANVDLEMCIYGGSAMMLAYKSREATKDVDAIIKPSDVALRLAKEVADQLGLHESWLNDDVKRFVSDTGTFAPLQIAELESAAKQHLKIARPSASYLLAMKCLACRSALPGYSGDLEDIRFLVAKMGIRALDQIDEHIARFYPHEALTTESRRIISQFLPQQSGGTT